MRQEAYCAYMLLVNAVLPVCACVCVFWGVSCDGSRYLPAVSTYNRVRMSSVFISENINIHRVEHDLQ